MKRRSFLQRAGSAMGAGAVTACTFPESRADKSVGVDVVQGIPRRTLGRTGAKISMVGYPGFALQHEDQKACTASLRRAFDNGINYFDVAPAYAKGTCEKRMGIGLQGLPRDQSSSTTRSDTAKRCWPRPERREPACWRSKRWRMDAGPRVPSERGSGGIERWRSPK